MDIVPFVAYFRSLLVQLKERFVLYFPNILGALVLLAVGWLLARLLKSLTNHLLIKLSGLLPIRAVQRGFLPSGIGQPASDIISRIVFWIVMFVFVTAATEMSGLPALTIWLRGVLNYLPTFLAAVMIALAGWIAGVLARDFVAAAAASANIAYSRQLGSAAQVGVVTITLMVSIDQLGIDTQFLTVIVAMALGAVLIGIAVAFGLGAKTAVANIIGCHYAQKSHQVGQMIRIGEDQGRIVEITPTAVLLDTPKGRVYIPGNRFGEISSALLEEEKDG